MEDTAIHNSKKTFSSGSSSSSFIEPKVIVIPHAISEFKLLEQTPIVDPATIAVDEEEEADDVVIIDEKDASSGKEKEIVDPAIVTADEKKSDDVVIIDEKGASNGKGKEIFDPVVVAVGEEIADNVVIMDEKDASNGKGKEKLMLDDFAGYNVIDGAIPSQHANEIVEEAIVPELSASASLASGTRVVPARSSSLSGTQTYLIVNGFEYHSKKVKSKSFFKSLFSKCCFMPKATRFDSKVSSLNHQATQNHVEMHVSPSASTTEQPTLTAGTENAHFHSNSAQSSPSSVDGQSDSDQDSLLNKLQLFKKFDILEDHVGHFFEVSSKCSNPSKEWVNYIADEWRMLENDLPDTIYVRAYEGRMDLLRAVIIGAQGTPYHDGLFFFDVQFPDSYPKVPPAVKYHSYGLKINPTLYRSGEVCLSLLGTGNSAENDYWRPYQSNMLQVLVSIQGLVLNGESFFDDRMSHNRSFKEQVYIDSLKTMIYTLNNPPKHFKDLVNGHFFTHAHDILAACRAYLDGVEVGYYLNGNLQAIAPGNVNNCSQYLKILLPSYIYALVKAFTRIGVKDCNQYLILGFTSEAAAIISGIPDI